MEATMSHHTHTAIHNCHIGALQHAARTQHQHSRHAYIYTIVVWMAIAPAHPPEMFIFMYSADEFGVHHNRSRTHNVSNSHDCGYERYGTNVYKRNIRQWHGTDSQHRILVDSTQ